MPNSSATADKTVTSCLKNKDLRHETIPIRDEFSSRSDLEYTIQMNRWFLQPIGLWPSENIYQKIAIVVEIFFCYFFMGFRFVSNTVNTFFVEKDPAIRLKMIGPLSFCLMGMTKFSLLVFHRGEISKCIEHIGNDWTNVRSSKDREIMMKEAKSGRFIAGLCASFMYAGGCLYETIMPLSSGVIVTPDNKTIRPLIYPVYDPLIDSQVSPVYEIFFTIEWFSGLVLYTITIGACSFAAIFAMHACGQFKVLVERLQKLVNGDNDKCDDSVDERMADIVELHLRALNDDTIYVFSLYDAYATHYRSLVNQVEEVLNKVCLVELVGCTMNICFLGYYFMTEFEQNAAINTFTYCTLLISFVFNILIFCYIGEMLAEQSKHVGTMTYMIEWYSLQDTKARGLILILMMTKYPARITAGKFAELSMINFSNVLKTALTYLNLLRTMTH